VIDAETAHRDELRSACYRTLSACFHPPDRDELLRDRTCVALAAALNELYPGTDAAAHAAALQHELTTVDALNLRVDHAALFVGPFMLKAPPYGSVYLEADRALMGKTTVAAAECYARAGLTVTLREPADHIAVELEFMQYLAALAAQAALRDDVERAGQVAGAARQFLTEHLSAWTPAFCTALRRNAETGFYRILADCLQGFVEADVASAPTGWYERETAVAALLARRDEGR
jgi:TorA maturation chaperone TorD